MIRTFRQLAIRSGMAAALFAMPALSLANEVTFSCTGFPQYFVVPTGVVNLTVTVTGGAGGDSAGSGGAGGIVTANIPVTPHQVLTIQVGCQPFNASQGSPVVTPLSGFGFAAGGTGGIDITGQFAGGGGGGATAILKSDGTPLIVAGGGGGAGKSGIVHLDPLGIGTGGNGGDGGSTATGNGGHGGPSPNRAELGGVGGILGGSSTQVGGNAMGGSPGSGGAGGGGYPTGGGAGAMGGTAGGGGGGGGLSYTTSPVTNVALSVATRSGSKTVPDDGSVVIDFDGNAFQQSTLAQCTGATTTYTIPVGATSLHIVAVGASGGFPYSDFWGNAASYSRSGVVNGTGSGVQTDIPAADFPASKQLIVAVGCQGGEGGQAVWFSSTAPGGAGGFGIYPGGTGGIGDKLSGTQPSDGASGGGGGGGASGVTYTGIAGIPLVTAGGGGGAGAYGNYIGVVFSGGNGGNGGLGVTAAINGGDGAGVGGGGGGKGNVVVFTRAGGDAIGGSNAGGGGGAGGGADTLDVGVTSQGGHGGTNIAAGGGGGMGGLSSPGSGAAPIVATSFDTSVYFGRHGSANGLVIITPIF